MAYPPIKHYLDYIDQRKASLLMIFNSILLCIHFMPLTIEPWRDTVLDQSEFPAELSFYTTSCEFLIASSINHRQSNTFALRRPTVGLS